jgi:uncharacterized protein (DUF2164 family)
MARIELDKAAREALARRLARHLKDELDVDVAPFDAVALLDFMTEAMGPYFYNQGVYDAQAVVKARADGIVEALYEIEKPVGR